MCMRKFIGDLPLNHVAQESILIISSQENVFFFETDRLVFWVKFKFPEELNKDTSLSTTH